MTNTYTKLLNSLEKAITIEKAIEILRCYDFRFMEVDSLKFSLEMKKDWHYEYSWAVRRVDYKEWDGTFVVGIKMWGKKTSKILIYHSGKWVKTIRIAWKDKADINFRKLVISLKFPEYLNYEDRRKWRTEYHKQKKNPQRIPTEWYVKILPDVQILAQ